MQRSKTLGVSQCFGSGSVNQPGYQTADSVQVLCRGADVTPPDKAVFRRG
jgi:hypothetical protein